MSKPIEDGTATGKTIEGNFQYSELNQRRIDTIIEIQSGTFWILQAIAIYEIKHGNITAKKIKKGKLDEILFSHASKLQEIHEQLKYVVMLRHTLEQPPTSTTQDRTEKPPTTEDIAEKINKFLADSFFQIVLDTLEAREKLSTCKIVMVVGQQGVGKTAVIDFFGSKGYEIVSMSKIIREMLVAWGLDPTETIDKIIGGKRARKYFYSDILVQLALHNLVSEGKRKMVIDGPRSVGEAEAVIELGGILIGVKAVDDVEIDRKIREQRIIKRAKEDPSRAADVVYFPIREKEESENIKKILDMVKPDNIILNEGVSKRELRKQLQARYASMNAKPNRDNIG